MLRLDMQAISLDILCNLHGNPILLLPWQLYTLVSMATLYSCYHGYPLYRSLLTVKVYIYFTNFICLCITYIALYLPCGNIDFRAIDLITFYTCNSVNFGVV